MSTSSTHNDATIYQRPVELLQRLIQFDTTNPPGNEVECIHYINTLLTEAGFETLLLGPDPARPNLVTRLKGRGDARPLLLQGHIDVVPQLDRHGNILRLQARLPMATSGAGARWI